ncbi:Uncharacterized protein APZ42_020254 [Daphnia magna]|uniref:Uncharacterized protein n=1 Tax=Daphnia magna TaxID=35525 RepID=A0A0P6C4S5_9CRUS|nr:Uncharacterized protein APZ42_020254 [Daphnia magna]
MGEVLPLLFVLPTYPPTSAITQPTLNYRTLLFPPPTASPNEMPDCIIFQINVFFYKSVTHLTQLSSSLSN